MYMPGDRAVSITSSACVTGTGQWRWQASLAPGSYQAYDVYLASGQPRYSAVLTFAVSSATTTTVNFSSAPYTTTPVIPVRTPSAYTRQGGTQIIVPAGVVTTTGSGTYTLNVGSWPTPPAGYQWYTMTLAITPPLPYRAVTASVGTPGSVLSATALIYPWGVTGTYTTNHFTLYSARARLPIVAAHVPTADPGIEITKYYLFNGQRVALRRSSEGPVLYLYRDHLGSTIAISGTVSESQRYWPYGSVMTGAISSTLYQYTGQLRDTGIGLYYYGARWYDSQLGVFAQPDTIVPDPGSIAGLNRYLYVLGNPLRYVDPDGRSECDDEICLRFGTRTHRPPRSFPAPLPQMQQSGYGYSAQPPVHPGVDFGSGVRPTIRASGRGSVIIADACTIAACDGRLGKLEPEYNGGYGNVVLIEYLYDDLPPSVRDSIGLSPGESIYFLYAHLQDASDLEPGTSVQSGGAIGIVGNSGNSSGPHLHLEVRIGRSASLPPGVMCSDKGCGSADPDPQGRMGMWYAGTERNNGAYHHFDPAGIPFVTWRELRALEVDYGR